MLFIPFFKPNKVFPSLCFMLVLSPNSSLLFLSPNGREESKPWTGQYSAQRQSNSKQKGSLQRRNFCNFLSRVLSLSSVHVCPNISYQSKSEKKVGVHWLQFRHKSSQPVGEHSSSRVLKLIKFAFENHLSTPFWHVEISKNIRERNFWSPNHV